MLIGCGLRRDAGSRCGDARRVRPARTLCRRRQSRRDPPARFYLSRDPCRNAGRREGYPLHPLRGVIGSDILKEPSRLEGESRTPSPRTVPVTRSCCYPRYVRISALFSCPRRRPQRQCLDRCAPRAGCLMAHGRAPHPRHGRACRGSRLPYGRGDGPPALYFRRSISRRLEQVPDGAWPGRAGRSLSARRARPSPPMPAAARRRRADFSPRWLVGVSDA